MGQLHKRQIKGTFQKTLATRLHTIQLHTIQTAKQFMWKH